jgi:hypothetical protein
MPEHGADAMTRFIGIALTNAVEGKEQDFELPSRPHPRAAVREDARINVIE